jgi:hypothetical protein
VIGQQPTDEVHPLTRSDVALAVDFGGELWAGLGVTLTLGRAFADSRVACPLGSAACAKPAR